MSVKVNSIDTSNRWPGGCIPPSGQLPSHVTIPTSLYNIENFCQMTPTQFNIGVAEAYSGGNQNIPSALSIWSLRASHSVFLRASSATTNKLILYLSVYYPPDTRIVCIQLSLFLWLHCCSILGARRSFVHSSTCPPILL